MAICFDLQISFLDDEVDHSAFAALLAQRIKPFRDIEFHPLSHTFVTVDGPYQPQQHVTPKNVGFAVSYDTGQHREMDDEECLDLSLHMYDFIRDLPYYQIALVGWEINFLSDYLTWDESDRVIEVAEVEGLVAAKRLFEHVADKAVWVEFDKNHYWIPCESAMGNIFGDD
ncbi:MAG: hypothetical protein OEZ39_00790 [Gammaproteobacteria bacterium]|nr:hypothetical protein [Gammaproteobacteria bacterium]MDH5650386.1 hypothetical protein [Gammaproteobacteria bacterium]